MIEVIQTTCPNCWERFETTVDCSAGSAQYFEDCPVCCQSIRFDLTIDDEGAITGFDASRENE
jgi:hypothetical protein